MDGARLGLEASAEEQDAVIAKVIESALEAGQDSVKRGPDLLPVLREAEITVLFCPPVLLTTLTTNPQLDLAYPLCRYIVPAGEAFPSADGSDEAARGGRSALAPGLGDAEDQLGYAEVGTGAAPAFIWHRSGSGQIVMTPTPPRPRTEARRSLRRAAISN